MAVEKNNSSAGSDDRLDRVEKSKMPLQRQNFILMGVAAAAIVIGFLLMTGSSTEGDTFNPDIFSTRRIVVGPTIAFLGFLFMGFAIMFNPRKK